MWNTFDRIRPHLEEQYRNWAPNPETGLSPEELEKLADRCFESHRGEPLILTKAAIFELILTKARIGVDPADWFADHLQSGNVMNKYQGLRKAEGYRKLPSDCEDASSLYPETGTGYAALDLSHTSPDWKSVLELGPTGLRDRALHAQKSAETEEQRIFYTAVAVIFDAMRKFIERLAEEAERVGAERVSGTLRAIAHRPPETFQEALQLSLLYDTCQELEGEPVRSQGLFDRLFLPFYRHDLQNGILTRDQAKELLKFFWTKFYAQGHPNGKNFGFGGLEFPGNDTTNELTELGFEVYRELNTINPKLTFRVSKKTPDFILRRVAECIQAGITGFVFANEETAREMFRKRGKEPRDIYDFIFVGCYEPAIMGREISCTMAGTYNLLKPVELLFHNGNDPRTGAAVGLPCPLPRNSQELEAAYFRQLTHQLTRIMERGKLYEKIWPEVNPSPLLSGTMPECIRKGRDISDSGTKYNTSGIMCAGIGSAADALAAVEYLVFERNLCSMTELKNALDNNWNGYETLRLEALNHAPKWGISDPSADAIARRITEHTANLINHTPNTRGGTFQMGLWSIDQDRTLGSKTGATPDGRLSGAPLSRNTGSTTGMDRRGITALMNSAMKLDHSEFPDGSVLDIMLHPSAVSGKEGPDIITSLIRTFFAGGGLAIQFNILSAEDLKQAQKEPEKYSNLQVRVCGWNNRFILLSPEEQALFIAKAEAGE